MTFTARQPAAARTEINRKKIITNGSTWEAEWPGKETQSVQVTACPMINADLGIATTQVKMSSGKDLTGISITRE